MPVLIGKNCRLRPLARSDMGRFLTWRQDRQLRGAVLGYSLPVTAEMEAGWFDQMLNEQSRKVAFFTIAVAARPDANQLGDPAAAEDNPIGFCRLTGIDWIARHAEFGILIGDRDRQRRGFGAEATAMLCRYGFDDLNLDRLHLRVREDNHAALRLYERLGFQIEGRLRRHAYVDGAYHDLVLMGLLNTERAAIDTLLD
jgi:RimJ/RimL family protein N-acetyltransferase